VIEQGRDEGKILPCVRWGGVTMLLANKTRGTIRVSQLLDVVQEMDKNVKRMHQRKTYQSPWCPPLLRCFNPGFDGEELQLCGDVNEGQAVCIRSIND